MNFNFLFASAVKALHNLENNDREHSGVSFIIDTRQVPLAASGTRTNIHSSKQNVSSECFKLSLPFKLFNFIGEHHTDRSV